MRQVFNKNFFGFLSGFLGLVFAGLIFVFAAGYYQNNEEGNDKGLEAKTPIQQIKVDNALDSGAVGKSLGFASSTRGD